jgi:hypothetical protein
MEHSTDASSVQMRLYQITLPGPLLIHQSAAAQGGYAHGDQQAERSVGNLVSENVFVKGGSTRRSGSLLLAAVVCWLAF